MSGELLVSERDGYVAIGTGEEWCAGLCCVWGGVDVEVICCYSVINLRYFSVDTMVWEQCL